MPLLIISVQIKHSDRVFILSALINSSPAGVFMDHTTATTLKIPLCMMNDPPRLNTIHGEPIEEGTIRFRTIPVTLFTSCLHTERISFLVLPKHPIILGMPWLKKHDPIISWTTRDIAKWSQVHKEIPKEYAAYSKVISKAKATKLPPHRPCDCTIELLPGTTPPRCRVYPLSGDEH